MKALNPYFYTLNPDILAYENAWVNYMHNGERNHTVINDTIWDSWERCRKTGLTSDSYNIIPAISKDELNVKLEKNRQLLKEIIPFMNSIYSVVSGPGFMVSACDSDGVILKTLCDDVLIERATQIGLVDGGILSEKEVGTNSVSLALKNGEGISVTGAEHYQEIFHNLTSASAPLFDYTGKMLGVISVWGRHEHTTPYILGMVKSNARAIEDEIHIKAINEQLIENNKQLSAILRSVSDGTLYIRGNAAVQANNVMIELLGRSDIISKNQNVEDIVITEPDISQILKKEDRDNINVTLFGEKNSYKCIVNKKTVLGAEGTRLGTVLIFKQVEEIHKLAKTINKYAARFEFKDIIGESETIKESVLVAQRASEHDARIVIEGESGTGKEMFAQSIHNMSDRKHNPFVAIDCGAIPRELFESTLFGYEKGAYTGAKAEGSAGAFEIANRGTLFLDEIGNLPIDMQIKLLRVLQEKTIVRIGSSVPIPVDVRVIVATNENLQSLVKQGTFRNDLFYRLNVVYIKTPPLRERLEDIPLLVKHYLSTVGVKDKKNLTIEQDALDVLQGYVWPGNIRQLFNAIEYAGIMASGAVIKKTDLPLEIREKSGWSKYENNRSKQEGTLYGMTLEKMTENYVHAVLENNGNSVSKAAKILGISRPTIYKIINRGDKHDRT